MRPEETLMQLKEGSGDKQKVVLKKKDLLSQLN